jgi:hypothetical protein
MEINRMAKIQMEKKKKGSRRKVELQKISENLGLSNISIFDCFFNSLSLDNMEVFSSNANAKKSMSFVCPGSNSNASGILSEYSEKGMNFTSVCKSLISSSKFSDDALVLFSISDLCFSNSSKANSGEYKLCSANNNFLTNDHFKKNVNSKLVPDENYISLFLEDNNLYENVLEGDGVEHE